MRHSRNGTRLLAMPELAADVPFSLKCDAMGVVAQQINGEISIPNVH